MPRRQALEALEDEGETPFVGPDEARTLLQDRSRPIGVDAQALAATSHANHRHRHLLVGYIGSMR
jgi:hypothetical protein